MTSRRRCRAGPRVAAWAWRRSSAARSTSTSRTWSTPSTSAASAACTSWSTAGTAPRSAPRPRVLRELGAHVEVLHAAPDGTNINDGCGSTHPADLQRAVVAVGADAGLAFDGDADRVIAVDERGEIVDGDQMLAIAAIDLHERGMLRGDAIVATVMSNLGLHRTLRDAGIEVVEVESATATCSTRSSAATSRSAASSRAT